MGLYPLTFALVATSFKIDDGQFFMAVDNLVDKTGLEVKEVLRLTGRHLVETLLKLTPPHSGRVGKAFAEKSAEQRGKGRRSLEMDIARGIGVVKELKLYNDPKVRKAINSKDLKTLSKIIGKPVLASLPNEYHYKFRNRRGKVSKGTGKQAFVVNKGVRTNYVNRVAQRIGAYKSGWNKAAQRLKARTRGGWVAWAKRHTTRGMIRDKSSKINWPRQEIIFANLADYATSSTQTSRWLRYAQGISMGKMNRFFETMVKRRMEKEMGLKRGSIK